MGISIWDQILLVKKEAGLTIQEANTGQQTFYIQSLFAIEQATALRFQVRDRNGELLIEMETEDITVEDYDVDPEDDTYKPQMAGGKVLTLSFESNHTKGKAGTHRWGLVMQKDQKWKEIMRGDFVIRPKIVSQDE